MLESYDGFCGNAIYSAETSFASTTAMPATASKKIGTPDKTVLQDAISALEGLGFSKQQVLAIATKVFKENQNISIENLISSSLKLL